MSQGGSGWVCLNGDLHREKEGPRHGLGQEHSRPMASWSKGHWESQSLETERKRASVARA